MTQALQTQLMIVKVLQSATFTCTNAIGVGEIPVREHALPLCAAHHHMLNPDSLIGKEKSWLKSMLLMFCFIPHLNVYTILNTNDRTEHRYQMHPSNVCSLLPNSSRWALAMKSRLGSCLPFALTSAAKLLPWWWPAAVSWVILRQNTFWGTTCLLPFLCMVIITMGVHG